MLTGGLYYTAIGDGPPLVQFRTVLPSYKNPTGLACWAERRSILPLARRFTVYSIGRRPGIAPGMTMAEIATERNSTIIFPIPVEIISIFRGLAERFGPTGS
jgi:hypothetical protein